MFKRFMRSMAIQKSIGVILAGYVLFVRYTTRWTEERVDQIDPLIQADKGFIGLIWHSRFLMLEVLKKKIRQKPYMLISLSKDGDLVALTAENLGLSTIRGSSRKAGSQKAKGGSTALRKMVNVIENSGCMVMTPDGPKGPRQRMSGGALRLSKMTGAPIIHCTLSVKNRIQFKSWDRFVLPLPFGRGIIIWGTPVSVPADASDLDIQTYKDQIETEMNMLLADADRRLGHAPINPAELAS